MWTGCVNAALLMNGVMLDASKELSYSNNLDSSGWTTVTRPCVSGYQAHQPVSSLQIETPMDHPYTHSHSHISHSDTKYRKEETILWMLSQAQGEMFPQQLACLSFRTIQISHNNIWQRSLQYQGLLQFTAPWKISI